MRNDVFPIDSATRITLGVTTLDLDAERLEGRDGAVVDLRPQAFSVLRHLAMNPGRLVSKEELFAAVWPDVVVTDDSLVQAVGDVRRALGADGHRMVKTVPRRGYLLVRDLAGPATSADRASGTSDMTSSPAVEPAVEKVPLAGRPSNWARLAAAVVVMAGLVTTWLLFPLGSTSKRVVVAPTTLAVLPFDSVSVTGEHPWIGDALSIGIASALSRLSNLPVLLYKRASGTAPPSPKVELSAATHLLAGSAQSDASQVRVTIHLTEVGSGRLLWSEHYERPLDNLFALQDEITAKTVTALQINLVEGDQARNRTHPKGNLKAWELATLGYRRFETGGMAPLAEARELFEEALALDPDYAWARSYLAATCFLEARFGFARQADLSMQRAFDEATRAVAIDPELPDAQSTLGSIQLARRQFDEAVASGRRALSLGPNDAEIHAVLAQTMLAIGEWDEAVRLSRRATQLAARPPSWYYVPLTYGLVFLGRSDEAVAAGERMTELAESEFLRRAARTGIVFAQVEGGRIDHATHVVDEMRPFTPGRGAAMVAAQLLFKTARDGERLSRALERAGMPP